MVKRLCFPAEGQTIQLSHDVPLPQRAAIHMHRTLREDKTEILKIYSFKFMIYWVCMYHTSHFFWVLLQEEKHP